MGIQGGTCKSEQGIEDGVTETVSRPNYLCIDHAPYMSKPKKACVLKEHLDWAKNNDASGLLMHLINDVSSESRSPSAGAPAGPRTAASSASTTAVPAAAGHGGSDPLRHGLVLHTCVFQHVGPFAAGASVAVFEMLTEVVGAVKFLRVVALAKFVHVGEVLDASLPVGRRGEFVTAVAADVRGRRVDRGGVEGGLDAGESSAGP